MGTHQDSIRPEAKGRRPCSRRAITRLREVFLAALLVGVMFCAGARCLASAKPGDPIPPSGGANEEAEALRQEEMAVVQVLARDFPGRVEPIILMGTVQYRLGHTDEALKLWQQALQRDPKHPEVYEKMGWFAMEKGRYQEAIAHWRKALEIAPGTSGVHSGMARALMGLNKHHEAIAHLEKEIEISPQSSFDYFLLGQEHMQVEQYEQAKASYEKAIAVDPNLTNAYYGLFTVCGRLGQQDEAKRHMGTFKRLKAKDMETLKDRNDAFDDLIDMRKDAAETMMLAGQAYQANGKLARAEQLVYRAAALDPKNATYHLHCGALSMQMGRLAQAEKAFGQVITLAPGSSRGYGGLAHLYLQANQKLPQARQLAEKAVALEPSGFNYYVLAWARDKNGDRPGARVAIRRAVELEPNNPRFRRIAELMEKRN